MSPLWLHKKRVVTSQVPFVTFDSIAQSQWSRGGSPRPVGCDVVWSANYAAHSSCHSRSVGCQSSCFFKYCEMEQEHESDSYVNQSLINISATVHTLVTHTPVRDLSPSRKSEYNGFELLKAKGYDQGFSGYVGDVILACKHRIWPLSDMCAGASTTPLCSN